MSYVLPPSLYSIFTIVNEQSVYLISKRKMRKENQKKEEKEAEKVM